MFTLEARKDQRRVSFVEGLVHLVQYKVLVVFMVTISCESRFESRQLASLSKS
jgi:hypothetical protein